jgi:hypothetical protein
MGVSQLAGRLQVWRGLVHWQWLLVQWEGQKLHLPEGRWCDGCRKGA